MNRVEFPSAEAAWDFSVNACASGHRVKLSDTAQPVTKRTFRAAVLSALVGGTLFGLLGAFAEAGVLGLPRLEPLFSAPVGSVTTLLAVFGGSLGALLGSLVALKPVTQRRTADHYVTVEDETDDVSTLARRYGGSVVVSQRAGNAVETPSPKQKLGSNRILAWLITVLAAGVLLTAFTYIWFLSINYGNGSDQGARIGYTLKNVQRVSADTPEEAGVSVAEMLGGNTVGVPTDPLAAAQLAPLAAAQGLTLTYGAAGTFQNLEAAQAALIHASPTIVIIADTEPAYALPAAYAAAHFGAPVITVSEAEGVLNGVQGKRILVAAPSHLISNDALEPLRTFGTVERVAAKGFYRHALLWAKGRWGDFGWGINPNFIRDGYYFFTLTNPADPGFAAAGLSLSYLGNYGPLLYTPQADLDELTDQFFWRVSPDFFVAPSDGPFMNVRVLGGPESVSYNAQARADLALETHEYRQQAQGASGLALLGWSWVFIGLAGAIWALFAMPVRLPETSFYPRLYWPLSMLVLGPLGIVAFFLSYQGRPVSTDGPMPSFVRPTWAKAVSATIMGMGIGMALMIASMYLFELNGLPLFRTLEFTPLFWLASPMAALMWFIMVVPAVLISTFVFMGPMMSEMHGVSYWRGVKKGFWPVVISMVASSVGMWTLVWWWMNWKPLMSAEDLWLWVSPLWWGAAMGFFTALIPNYVMAMRGWKNGGM